MNTSIRYRLPVWYRPWLILPVALFLLVGLGQCLTLPPNMIDPRKYPAFMDGGTDWGGSNIFFYSRVVMLVMGILGFLSLKYVTPCPDWQAVNKVRLFISLYKFHALAYLLCLYPCGLSGLFFCMHDCDTSIILFIEIVLWYILSAYFAIRLLSKGGVGSAAFFGMDVASFILLIVGFYCGYWLTGSEFNAHEIGMTRLLIRLAVQMTAYCIGMGILSWLLIRRTSTCSTPGC